MTFGALGAGPNGKRRLMIEPVGPLAPLSMNERAVVTLIAAGKSNQEIAVLRAVTINTVKTTVRNAYGKMQVQTRAQAVLWAFHHGLID